MNKISSGFTRLTEKELDNKVAQIITALTGNASFPTPAPTLAALQTKLTAYQVALAMPEGVARIQAVKSTREDLSTALEQLARNLDLTPNATDTQLATTGFDMHKTAAQTADAPPALSKSAPQTNWRHWRSTIPVRSFTSRENLRTTDLHRSEFWQLDPERNVQQQPACGRWWIHPGQRCLGPGPRHRA